MTVFELEPGTVFCLGGDKSMPKMRMHSGYVCMRDSVITLVTENDNVVDVGVEVMDMDAMYQQFHENTKEKVDEWVEVAKKTFVE